MKLLFRILSPLVVLGAAVWLAWFFVSSRPEPRKYSVPQEPTKVVATRLVAESYQIFLDTQGTVRPRTTSTMIPEVSGRVVEVSPNFREGGYFENGETLLKIDPVNYETAVVVAESAVAQATTALHEEEVRGQQAVENWRRLGKSGQPAGLAARLPQLAEAQARLRAAEAELEQSRRDLERTEVRAPFDGRILEQSVDVGQFVTSNTQLGRAFATDVMEVRLPLTNRQLAFVNLPESFRNDAGSVSGEGPEVLITARIGREVGEWRGRIVRVDSAIDEASRQLFVVAEVEDPYSRREGSASLPLKIGMFVDGHVKGEELRNVFVLPRQAVRVGGEVIVVDAESRIFRRKVEPVWSDAEKVVVPAEGGGISVGEVVCLTPITYPVNGAPVIPTIDGVTPEVEVPGGARGGERPGISDRKGGPGKGGEKAGAGKVPSREGAAAEAVNEPVSNSSPRKS